MYFPTLSSALDSCALTLQTLLKQSVPVDTGSLRDSIVVRASHNGTSITLQINLNDYWKWITKKGTHRQVKEPVPVDDILKLSPTILVQRYQSLNGAIEAIRQSLDNALEQDILNELNNL